MAAADPLPPLARPDGSTGALALRRLRRHWGLLAVCAGFLLAGALVLDDYDPGGDGPPQRVIGKVALNYFAGEGERSFGRLRLSYDRYYGAAFEAPLVLVERMLGLEDSRDVWLSRHMLTHLFFLVSGVFCYILVYRLFQNRLLALIAMALFVLHPRLYAHSFFNSKDLTFAAMFMIALYLTHRAFRRDTLAAFLVCGVGIGLLVNLRIMGIILFAAVLALRALDAAFARSREERGRVLLTGGAFALTAMLTYYATLPVLWTDPVGRFAELVETLGAHPWWGYNLFGGEWLYAQDGPPFDYVPVWVGITTPPVVLLLAALGVIALAWRGLRRPRDVLRNGPPRFGLLLIALPVVTVVAVVVLENTVYQGWRQFYFPYAPLLLLAIFGLHQLHARGGRWMRAGTWALAGMAVAVTVVSMVRIHPLEDSYYNGLVDRTTPDWLVSQYETDYWKQSHYGILRKILEEHPEQNIFGQFMYERRNFFSEKDRKRIHHPHPVFMNNLYSDRPVSDRYYTETIYNNTINSVKIMHINPERVETIIRSDLSTEPVYHSPFYTVHLYENVLVYIKESCNAEHTGEFFLHVYPETVLSYYPGETSNGEFINRDFNFHRRYIDRNRRCVAIAILPDIPISNIHTGQKNGQWSTRFGFQLPDVAPETLASDPVASSSFTIHRDGNVLIYARDECTDEDAAAPFYLHVLPVDPDDLDGPGRQYGFESRDFSLWDHGNRVGGRCVAVVGLPDYPVAGVRTGQYDETGARLWGVNFPVTPVDIAPAALSGDPVASSVFDVYRDGDTLVYVRDGCTEEEAGAAFFLHVVPVDTGDLPAERRQYGFANLDFSLTARGARTDGDCVAAVGLPAYPIASIRTGQYDGTGAIWETEFVIPDGE